MTYNVFGGTLSLTQSINHVGWASQYTQKFDRLGRNAIVPSDDFPVHLTLLTL